MTPREAGFTMPAEWEPHERTIVCWPARRELWGKRMDAARRDSAAVVAAIAAFEPVTLVVGGSRPSLRFVDGELLVRARARAGSREA